MKKDLKSLLNEVDKLFPSSSSNSKNKPYNYSLGKFPNGWQFNVINDWNKWFDNGFLSYFGRYSQPEKAVQAFLDYVKKHKINVKKLCKK
jgi:hypothetical protein